MKAIASRERDKLDIREVLAIQGDRVDRDLVRREIEEVMPATDARRVWLESVLSTA
ncbi:MAG: hypothetical protein AAB074_12740 [Planctomycetota bacterium]